MVLDCFASIEIDSRERLGPGGLEFVLMGRVVEKLRERGTECTLENVGSFCVYTFCTVDTSVVSVSLLAGYRLAKSHVHSAVWCSNHVSRWRRLLSPPSKHCLYSGISLTHVCDEVAKILSSDRQISQVQWMTPDEWHNTERSYAKTRTAPRDYEDWLPPRGKKRRRAERGRTFL